MYTLSVIVLALWSITNLIITFTAPLFGICGISDLKNMYINCFKSANILGYFIILLVTIWFLPFLFIVAFMFTCEVVIIFVLNIIQKIAFNKNKR